MPLKRKLSAFAIWCLLAVVLQLAAMHLSYLEIDSELDSTGEHLYDSVYNSTRINEVLLQSFTTLVASNATDARALNRFSSIIRERYPHVKALQVIRRTLPDTQTIVKAEAALLGNERFIIRHGTGGQDQIDVGSKILNDQASYPVLFVSPLNTQTRYLIGLDLRSHDVLGPTIDQSIQYPLPVASDLYYNEEKHKTFSLFQAVFSSQNYTQPIPSHLVALQIEYQGLLPPSFSPPANTNIIIRNEDGSLLLELGIPTNEAWQPSLHRQYSINRFGQTFHLEVTRLYTHEDINWILLIFLILFSAALFKAASEHYRQRQASLALKRERLIELDRSHKELEERVDERTAQLNQQLLENRLLSHRILQVQEQEKRLLARELHDELGQSLTAIRTDARILKNLSTNEASAVYNCAESIDAIALHIYNVTYDLMAYLRPSALDELGLVDSIRECASQLKLSEHNIELTTEYSGPLNGMSETYNITLYRLIQEALNNVVRHAKATKAHIELKLIESNQGDTLSLTITDNGMGIYNSKEKMKGDGGGFGLIGMRERIRALEGDLNIGASVGGGTRIKATLTVKEQTPVVESSATPPLTSRFGPEH